jgi:uncharacterized membrane protein
VSLYLILKWLHVLLAIAAVGTNLTYGVWLGRASREAGALPFALRGVKLLDDRIANPSYALLLVTGLALLYVGGWPITTPWILLALVLYAVLLLVGLLGYTPTLREQIRLAEASDPAGPAYQAVARRGTSIGTGLAVVVVVIVFLMVTKPGS